MANGLLSGADDKPAPGSDAPPFSLQGLDGEKHQLADYIGQPVVINFWGSFCDPCVEEMPMIEQFYKQYKDQGLVVLGLNLNEPRVTVRSFVRETGVTFPVLLDHDIVRKQYGVRSYPTTFFINSEGVIEDIFVGYMRESDFKYRLLRLMNE